jgi:hypothetical protein
MRRHFISQAANCQFRRLWMLPRRRSTRSTVAEPRNVCKFSIMSLSFLHFTLLTRVRNAERLRLLLTRYELGAAERRTERHRCRGRHLAAVRRISTRAECTALVADSVNAAANQRHRHLATATAAASSTAAALRSAAARCTAPYKATSFFSWFFYSSMTAHD